MGSRNKKSSPPVPLGRCTKALDHSGDLGAAELQWRRTFSSSPRCPGLSIVSSQKVNFTSHFRITFYHIVVHYIILNILDYIVYIYICRSDPQISPSMQILPP